MEAPALQCSKAEHLLLCVVRWEQRRCVYNAATLKNSTAVKLLCACRVVYEVVAKKSNAQKHADDPSKIKLIS